MKLLSKIKLVMQVLVGKVEEDAVDRLYDELPMYINIEADDREITEWKSDENK